MILEKNSRSNPHEHGYNKYVKYVHPHNHGGIFFPSSNASLSKKQWKSRKSKHGAKKWLRGTNMCKNLILWNFLFSVRNPMR